MTLNRAQRVITKIGACILFFRLLLPPWTEKIGNSERRIGSYFIFDPPDYKRYGSSAIDTVLLFFQVVVIVLGIALLVWWFRPRQAITQAPPQKPDKRSILQRFGILRSDVYVLLFLLLFVGLIVFAVLSGR